MGLLKSIKKAASKVGNVATSAVKVATKVGHAVDVTSKSSGARQLGRWVDKNKTAVAVTAAGAVLTAVPGMQAVGIGLAVKGVQAGIMSEAADHQRRAENRAAADAAAAEAAAVAASQSGAAPDGTITSMEVRPGQWGTPAVGAPQSFGQWLASLFRGGK